MGTIHTPPYVDGDLAATNRIVAAWLNDVNVAVFTAIGDGTTAPTTPAIVRTNLGLPASDGSSLIGFIASGSGAVARTLQAKSRDFISVMDFGAAGDGVTDDTAEIAAAFAALTQYQTLYFPPRAFKFNGAITVTTDDIGAHFDNTTFLVGDSGTAGTTVAGASGKMGFLFKQAHNFQLTGTARLLGQGVAGTTSLAGIVFDTCDGVVAPATIFCKTMAAGRFVIECTGGIFGDIVGNTMNGLQTFESPPTATAGSVEIPLGCDNCSFGNCVAILCAKPGRYLSVGFGSNNVGCAFGASVMSYNTNPNSAGHALAIRSAVSCAFGPVIATGGPYSALNVVQYAGDQALGYGIDRVTIESVIGVTGPTNASVDSLIFCESEDTAQLGNISIGMVRGSCAGEFGIYNTSAKLHIGSVDITGAATRLIACYGLATGFEPEVNIDSLRMGGNSGAASPVVVGKGGRFTCQYANVYTGPTAAVTAWLSYDAALGVGSLHNGIALGTVRYRQGGSTNNYANMVLMAGTSFSSNPIFHMDADGVATATLNFAGDLLKVKQGRWMSTAAPAAAVAYAVGDVTWKSDVAAAGIPGWVCTTAGSPGTWKAMAAVAA